MTTPYNVQNSEKFNLVYPSTMAILWHIHPLSIRPDCQHSVVYTEKLCRVNSLPWPRILSFTPLRSIKTLLSSARVNPHPSHMAESPTTLPIYLLSALYTWHSGSRRWSVRSWTVLHIQQPWLAFLPPCCMETDDFSCNHRIQDINPQTSDYQYG